MREENCVSFIGVLLGCTVTVGLLTRVFLVVFHLREITMNAKNTQSQSREQVSFLNNSLLFPPSFIGVLSSAQ